MAEIRISYSAVPPGQIGVRPLQVRLHETCRFTCADPGKLSMKFTKGSPLKNGATEIESNIDFVVEKSGRFGFICSLTPEGGGKPIILGDPSDPNSAAGGEIEVGL